MPPCLSARWRGRQISDRPKVVGRWFGAALPSVECLARIGTSDPLFARRAVASIVCCLAQYMPAEWAHHPQLAHLAYTLWEYAVNLQTRLDNGEGDLESDEMVSERAAVRAG